MGTIGKTRALLKEHLGPLQFEACHFGLIAATVKTMAYLDS